MESEPLPLLKQQFFQASKYLMLLRIAKMKNMYDISNLEYISYLPIEELAEEELSLLPLIKKMVNLSQDEYQLTEEFSKFEWYEIDDRINTATLECDNAYHAFMNYDTTFGEEPSAKRIQRS